MMALCLSMGLHWAVLQSAAWMGMVVQYSRGSTVSEAIQKTFDGNHPCKLCKIVREGKKSERKQDSNTPSKQLDPCVQFETLSFVFPCFPAAQTRRFFTFSDRLDLPSVPPPKAA